MSLNALDNPIERLAILPNAMNWRGGWVATEQYYLNDVVVSAVNQSSYILSGRTALLGGLDPSLSITGDWVELSSQTTGVQSVTTGFGIVNTGNQTNVNLEWTGVAGNGIAFDTTVPNVTQINNDGVITLTSLGAGINVDNTDPQNPVISNTGITSITAGTGIVSTGGSTPTISSTAGPVIPFTTNNVSVPTILTVSSTGITTVSTSVVAGLVAGGTYIVNLTFPVNSITTVNAGSAPTFPFPISFYCSLGGGVVTPFNSLLLSGDLTATVTAPAQWLTLTTLVVAGGTNILEIGADVRQQNTEADILFTATTIGTLFRLG